LINGKWGTNLVVFFFLYSSGSASQQTAMDFGSKDYQQMTASYSKRQVPRPTGEVELCINGQVAASGAYFGQDIQRIIDRRLREQMGQGLM